MKTRTKIAVAIAACALLGCEKNVTPEPAATPVTIRHTNPPPGLEIVCDTTRGLYAPAFGDSVYSGRNSTNRQDAIDHAWWLYAMWTNVPPNQPTWQHCE